MPSAHELEDLAVAKLEELRKLRHALAREFVGPDRTGDIADQVLREAMEEERHRAFDEGCRVTTSALVHALEKQLPAVRQGDIRAAVVRCLASGRMYADASWALTLSSEDATPSVENMHREYVAKLQQEHEELVAKTARIEGTLSEVAYLVGAAGNGTLLERGMRWDAMNEDQQRQAVLEAILDWQNRLREAKKLGMDR
jgi:hypothetical protein